MKTIPLTQGKVALVDDADYERVSCFKWYACKGRHTWYAQREVQGRTVSMHRFIAEPLVGMHVDHINGDGLDNQRENLRCVTRAQNAKNRTLNRDNHSGYRGVRFYHGSWHAYISSDGKRVYKSGFKTSEDAARCYNELSAQLHGEFGRPNEV